MSGLADTVPADRHPKSCSRWFASDATTGEAICDCGLAEETTAAGLYQHDLGAILRALGVGDYARSDSPHMVVHDVVLPAIKRLAAPLPRAETPVPVLPGTGRCPAALLDGGVRSRLAGAMPPLQRARRGARLRLAGSRDAGGRHPAVSVVKPRIGASVIAAHRFNNELRYRAEADPRQVHLTPEYVLEPVRRILGGIGLDPCTEPDNPTQAETFFAPPVDGAAAPWLSDRIFVNPPYGRARERWVGRCIEAAESGARVVLLMPAHTDTRLWQRVVRSRAAIIFIRGRVKFGVLRPNRRQAAASHPSALIGWNVDLGPAIHLGVLMSTPETPEDER